MLKTSILLSSLLLASGAFAQSATNSLKSNQSNQAISGVLANRLKYIDLSTIVREMERDGVTERKLALVFGLGGSVTHQEIDGEYKEEIKSLYNEMEGGRWI